MPLTGRITEWNSERGFGYVQAGGRRIFLHIREFKQRHGEPGIGDTVSFEMGADRQGRSCATRAVLHGAGTGAARAGRIKPVHSLILVFLILPGWAVYRGLGAMALGYFAGWILLVSAITYLTYAADKHQARRGVWRAPERALHLLEILGGWPGAFFAQRRLRHKSSKPTYQFFFTLIIGVHQLVAFDALRGWPVVRRLMAVIR